MKTKLLSGSLFILVVTVLSLVSCSESDDKCAKTGKVIGYDYTLCACCGGWLVEYADTLFRFYTVPEEDELQDWINKYSFPITIRFDDENLMSPCSDYKAKTMTCIELIGHNECSREGQIIDYRSEECLCCPGWIIATETDTIRVKQLPNDYYVRTLFDGSPISIQFDFEDTQGPCEQSYKEVTCIEIIN